MDVIQTNGGSSRRIEQGGGRVGGNRRTWAAKPSRRSSSPMPRATTAEAGGCGGADGGRRRWEVRAEAGGRRRCGEEEGDTGRGVDDVQRVDWLWSQWRSHRGWPGWSMDHPGMRPITLLQYVKKELG